MLNVFLSGKTIPDKYIIVINDKYPNLFGQHSQGNFSGGRGVNCKIEIFFDIQKEFFLTLLKIMCH